MRPHSSPEANATRVSHTGKNQAVLEADGRGNFCVLLTVTDGADAGPGAVVPADTSGGADEMVARETSEMDFVSEKILGAELGSVGGGFQRGAGGGSCERERGSWSHAE